MDWQWSLPKDADGSPEALLLHTNETESLEGHGIGVVVQVGVHELVGWHPLGVGACMLPHVQVVLGLLARLLIPGLRTGRVHVAAVDEGAARSTERECLSWSWASSLGALWNSLGWHQFWWRHLERGGEGLTQLRLSLVLLEWLEGLGIDLRVGVQTVTVVSVGMSMRVHLGVQLNSLSRGKKQSGHGSKLHFIFFLNLSWINSCHLKRVIWSFLTVFAFMNLAV